MEDLKRLDVNLRAWQEEALICWAQNSNRGIIKVVTGRGKTRFALRCSSDPQTLEDLANWLHGD